jgi:hypothetical protein
MGVIDLPYANAPQKTKKGKRKKRQKGATQTTGDVAEWLENKYHIMRIFFELHEKDIARLLEESMAGALENVLMGAPATPLPQAFAGAEQKINDMFQKFLDNKELERLGYSGVPTRAALEGKSARFKSGKGPRRPSFIDTGLYESAFRAWMADR